MEDTRWERLEEYLFDHDKDGTDFSVHEYIAEVGISSYDGPMDIQSYLKAQRAKKSRTLYVLRRKPGTRTVNSRWAVGVRTQDARLIGRALADDTKRKVTRAFMPDLVRLRQLNPRAAKRVELQINSVVDAAMVILANAAEGMRDEDD